MDGINLMGNNQRQMLQNESVLGQLAARSSPPDATSSLASRTVAATHRQENRAVQENVAGHVVERMPDRSVASAGDAPHRDGAALFRRRFGKRAMSASEDDPGASGGGVGEPETMVPMASRIPDDPIAAAELFRRLLLEAAGQGTGEEGRWFAEMDRMQLWSILERIGR